MTDAQREPNGGGDDPAPVRHAAPVERVIAVRALDADTRLAWSAMYDVLVRRATHEVNNALNAVAMNLEVARLRAVPGADAARVAPFAAAAAEAHDEVVAIVQPLLALARGPLDDGCDVRAVAAQIVAVLGPGVRTKGGSLVLDRGDGLPARTTTPVGAVRLAVAELLHEATTEPGGEWRCQVAAEPEPTLVLAAGGAGSVTRALAFPST